MLKYKEPTFVRLPKNKLKVNTDFYQKQYVPRNVQKLVKVWDDNAVGTLTVAHDKNGEYWVVDGQHRLLAAKKIATVKTLPCMVHDSEDVDEDARLYVKINTTHKKPDARHLFRVAYSLKDEPDFTIGNILEDYGFSWRMTNSKESKKPVAGCIGSIKKVYNECGREVMEEAIRILSIVHKNDTMHAPLHSNVLYGVVYLLEHYTIPNKDKFEEAVSKCTPMFLKACCEDAVSMSPLVKSGSPWSILAQGISNAVNSKFSGRNKSKLMVTLRPHSEEQA